MIFISRQHSSNLTLFVVKESLVDGSNGDGDPEMLKTCKWMNEKERNWLVDRTWTVSLILQAACILFGFMSMVIILMSSCCSIRKGLFRIMSIGFGANAMLNMTPMIIFLKSELCTGNDGAGICDESQTNCVSTCEMSSGSWQLLATSFMWISAMISAWVISPQEKIFSIQESDGMQDEESPDDKSSQTLRSSSTSSLESDEEDTPDNGNVMYNVNL